MQGYIKLFPMSVLTALTPLGLKIRARNDRYYTSRPEFRQNACNNRYNTTLSKSRSVIQPPCTVSIENGIFLLKSASLIILNVICL